MARRWGRRAGRCCRAGRGRRRPGARWPTGAQGPILLARSGPAAGGGGPPWWWSTTCSPPAPPWRPRPGRCGSSTWDGRPDRGPHAARRHAPPCVLASPPQVEEFAQVPGATADESGDAGLSPAGHPGPRRGAPPGTGAPAAWPPQHHRRARARWPSRSSSTWWCRRSSELAGPLRIELVAGGERPPGRRRVALGRRGGRHGPPPGRLRPPALTRRSGEAPRPHGGGRGERGGASRRRVASHGGGSRERLPGRRPSHAGGGSPARPRPRAGCGPRRLLVPPGGARHPPARRLVRRRGDGRGPQARLDEGLAAFRRAVGAEVTGEVGDANPVYATAAALRASPTGTGPGSSCPRCRPACPLARPRRREPHQAGVRPPGHPPGGGWRPTPPTSAEAVDARPENQPLDLRAARGGGVGTLGTA